MATVVGGGVVAVISAWIALGLPVVATRGYVDQQFEVQKAADAKTIQEIHTIELELLVSRRDRVEEDVFNQQQTIKKSPDDFDAQKRLRSLQDQLEELNGKIADMRRGK